MNREESGSTVIESAAEQDFDTVYHFKSEIGDNRFTLKETRVQMLWIFNTMDGNTTQEGPGSPRRGRGVHSLVVLPQSPKHGRLYPHVMGWWFANSKIETMSISTPSLNSTNK